jgi:hypothetical protein
LIRQEYEIKSKSSTYASSETIYASSEIMSAGLERLKLLGVNPSFIIDVGAAQGTWTAKAIEQWPKSSYQLIEPLHEQKPVLDEFKKKHANINYHLAVAGEEQGKYI